MAETLKTWIQLGQFTLTQPVEPLPLNSEFVPQDGQKGRAINLE